MADADIVLIADLDVSRVDAKLNRITRNTSRRAGQAGRSFSKMSKGQRQEVRQLGFALQRMGIQGTAAFGEMFVAGGIAGVGIGVIAVSVVALIKTLKSLATAAVDAFKSVTKLGVEAAKEYEIAGAQFKAVMKGNEKAAEAALNRILRLSKQVGQNLTGVARAFIPEVESLDQLEDILKIATALAQYQPEQGILGARIALQEFLSGETRSLRRRFEVPQADIDKMKEAFETGGIQAAIDELNRFLARTGRSLEDLSDTATVSFNRMREGWRQLAAIYGEPIVASAKSEIDDLNSVLEDLRPVLNAIATAFGEVVGKLVELVGTEVREFIEDIDFENIHALAQAFDGVVTAFSLFIDFLSPGQVLAEGLDTVVYKLIGTFLSLQKTFLDLAWTIATSRQEIAFLAKDLVIIDYIMGAIDFGVQLGGSLTLKKMSGAMKDATEIAANMAQAFAGAEGDVDALGEAFVQWHVNMALWQQGEFGVPDLEVEDTSGEEIADWLLSRDKAVRKLTELTPALQEAQDELDEIRSDFDDKALAKFDAITTRYDRRVLEADIRAGRKFVELEITRLEKIDDLRTNYNAKFAKNQLDLSRTEEDIARRHGRRVLQIEEDLAEDKIDLQEEYLRRLDEINRRFDFDAQEAIRANDAIAYLRIQRRRKFELNEAKISRDEDIEDAADKADRRREELADTLEQEIEDAQIANRRKLDDLNTWLNEQTAAIDLWAEREEAKRLRRLDDERADAFRAREQQREDYNKWWVDLDTETDKGATAIEDRMQEMRDTIEEIFNTFPDLVDFMSGTQLRALGLSAGRPGAGGLRDRTQQREIRQEQHQQAQLNQARTLAYNLGLAQGNTPAELQGILQSMDLEQLQETIRLWGGGSQSPTYVPTAQTQGQDPTNVRMEELRDEARAVAAEYNSIYSDTGNYFAQSYIDRAIADNITIAGLEELIEEWKERVQNKRFKAGSGFEEHHPGYQSGGFIRRGVTARVNEPYDGDRENPELYLPKDGSAGTGKGFDPDSFLPRVESADPMLLGGSLRYGKIKTQLFTPLADGYIVPIQQLARLTGKPGLDIMATIQEIIGRGGKGRSAKILEQLGIKGRAFGGPVKAGIPVVVGEPLPGQRANPEIFLPSINSISGIQEILREVGTSTKKPIGKSRRIEALKDMFPGGGPTRLPTKTTAPPGPTRLPTETTGGAATGKGFYDPILDRGVPSTGAFESASLALRQMYFSPPFISRARGGDTYDNRRTVEVVNPEVNTELSQIEIAQIKELYAQLRLEESLV